MSDPLDDLTKVAATLAAAAQELEKIVVELRRKKGEANE